MATFSLSINLDNSMFADDAAPEISRILKDLSEFTKKATITENELPMEKPLKDLNGNKVGYLHIKND